MGARAVIDGEDARGRVRSPVTYQGLGLVRSSVFADEPEVVALAMGTEAFARLSEAFAMDAGAFARPWEVGADEAFCTGEAFEALGAT
jgi:hypothetical protein